LRRARGCALVRAVRRQRLARIALALLLSVVAADLAGTLFLIRNGVFLGHPLPPFGALTHPKQLNKLDSMDEAPKGIGTFDAELGWTWAPSSVSADGPFAINALGARGPREYGPLPAPEKRRVITFGDSFTFGDEVPVEASFQWQMEHLEPELEVLNFGVSGYGTDQALLRYERIGRGLSAQVACMGILLENIGRNVNRYRPLWNTLTGICMAKPRFVLADGGSLELVSQPFASRTELRAAILDGSVIERVAEHEYWLGRPTLLTGRVSSLLRIVAGYFAYRERTPARLWRDPEGEPFQVTVAILERFHRQALADGARLAPILIFPSKEDLREYALPERPYWVGLLAELDRRGIPYIDLIEPLTASARETREDPPGASLYSGGHLSRVGNGVVAGEILTWLKKHPP